MDDTYSVLLNKTYSKYIQILSDHDIAILYSFISITQLKVNFFNNTVIVPRINVIYNNIIIKLLPFLSFLS